MKWKNGGRGKRREKEDKDKRERKREREGEEWKEKIKKLGSRWEMKEKGEK